VASVVSDSKYYVGEFPTDALEIKVVDHNGAPYELALYDSAILVTDVGLPTGNTTIFDTDLSLIHHTWTGAFATAGRFMAQLHLVKSGKTDYASTIAIEVVVPTIPNPYWSP
jgi:hypothetical protein